MFGEEASSLAGSLISMGTIERGGLLAEGAENAKDYVWGRGFITCRQPDQHGHH
jgi:hypothetical protein